MNRMGLLALALAAGGSLGCVSGVKVSDLEVLETPSRLPSSVMVDVDTGRYGDRGEAGSLATGLAREAREAGYSLTEGGLLLSCHFTRIYNGHLWALQGFFQPGIRSHEAQIQVRLAGPEGRELAHFLVTATVYDDRYLDLCEHLENGVARRIVQEMTNAIPRGSGDHSALPSSESPDAGKESRFPDQSRSRSTGGDR
jgi:hypothetical protein